MREPGQWHNRRHAGRFGATSRELDFENVFFAK
jgi:hypothetical protein